MMIKQWIDEEKDASFLHRMGLKFLNGHSIYLGNWVIRAPLALPPVLYITCAFGLMVKMVQKYDDLATVIDCAHMMIHMIVGIQTSLLATKQKSRVLALSALLDDFETYPELKAESKIVKENCEKQISAMYTIFSNCILITINAYILFPLFKLFTEAGRSDLSSVLVWPMWMGVPENTWWGFTIMLSFEYVTSLFLLLSVMYTVPYLACLGKMTVGQCQLLTLSIQSLDEKVAKTAAGHSISYEKVLNKEINDSAQRLHLIQMMATEVADLFQYYLSSFYYGGVLALCMSGLLAVAVNNDVEESLKFMGVLSGELVAMGVATFVSEEIIDGFLAVRTSIYNVKWHKYPKSSCKSLQLMSIMCGFRGLRTVLGYELTLFHLADVLNASYKYYNLLLLTMK